MICIYTHRTTPAFNLAAEEYLFSLCSEDCFMLWQNGPAVIVGRNQNAWSQINPRFITENRIPVIRRSSGGGAVYHDAGNVNFTFIRRRPRMLRTDYREFLQPVHRFLRKLDIPVRYEGKSDLAIGAFKISGNAQHVHGGKVLHHGTLLFDADLAALSDALRISPGKYADKAVDSVRKPVTNIRPHLKLDLCPAAFMDRFMQDIQKAFSGRRLEFTDADKDTIQTLAAVRYGTWQWNFGHSPSYRFCNALPTEAGPLTVEFNVRAGILRDVRLSGGGLSGTAWRDLEAALGAGCRHEHQALTESLSAVFKGGLPAGIPLDNLIQSLF